MRAQQPVRSLGLCNYNRKFTKGYTTPLTPLTGNLKDFEWFVEAQQAFEQLRNALAVTPTLVHFDPEAEHELRTDTSSHAIGAVLCQKHADPPHTGVVLYHSKVMSSAQRNYSATERELLAAFSSIMALSHYLLGQHFVLVTDHRALSLLKNHNLTTDLLGG